MEAFSRFLYIRPIPERIQFICIRQKAQLLKHDKDLPEKDANFGIINKYFYTIFTSLFRKKVRSNHAKCWRQHVRQAIHGKTLGKEALARALELTHDKLFPPIWACNSCFQL